MCVLVLSVIMHHDLVHTSVNDSNTKLRDEDEEQNNRIARLEINFSKLQIRFGNQNLHDRMLMVQF